MPVQFTQMPKNDTKPIIKKDAGKKPSLKINAISNWVTLAVNVAIGLFITPYLIHYLGKEDYGIWTLVGSFLGYYGLLRLGVGAGIMRYVPLYKGRNDIEAASEVVSTGLTMMSVIGIIIVLISVLLAEPIVRFYKAVPELASLIRIFGIAAALECPMRILDASIRSQEHWVAANTVTILNAFARAIGLVVCVHMKYGLLEMGYVVLSVSILSLVLASVVFIHYCPFLRLRLTMVKFSHMQSLLSFGLFTTITTLVYSLTLKGHSLIIGKLISLEAVTIFAIPAFILQNVQRGLMAPARVFMPRFAYLDGKGFPDKFVELFLRGTRLIALLASGIFLIVVLLGPSFIRLWIDGDFSEGEIILPWLSIGYLLSTSQSLIGPLLAGTGRQKERALIAVFEGAIGFGMSVYFGMKFGMIGVAVGFAISRILFFGLVYPFYICRILKINFQSYYLCNLLRPWGIFTVLVLLVRQINFEEFVNNWTALFLMGLALAFTYATSVFMIGIDTEEKKRLVQFLRRRIFRFQAS